MHTFRASSVVLALVLPLLASCVAAPDATGEVEPTVQDLGELDEAAVEGEPAEDEAVTDEDGCGECEDCEPSEEDVENVAHEPSEAVLLNSMYLGDADLSALPRGGEELTVDESPVQTELASGELAYLVRANEDSSLAVVRGFPHERARVDILPPVDDVDLLTPVAIVERAGELWVFANTYATRFAGDRYGTIIARWDGRAWRNVSWEGEPIADARVSADGAIVVTTTDDEDGPTWTVLAERE